MYDVSFAPETKPLFIYLFFLLSAFHRPQYVPQQRIPILRLSEYGQLNLLIFVAFISYVMHGQKTFMLLVQLCLPEV